MKALQTTDQFVETDTSSFTSFSSGISDLEVKFNKRYVVEALNHYQSCGKHRLDFNNVLALKTHKESYDKCKQLAEKCRQIQLLHENYLKERFRYLHCTKRAMCEPKLHLSEDQIRQMHQMIECSIECQDQQHYNIIKHLLIHWGFWEEGEDKGDDEDLCDFAIKKLREQMAKYECEDRYTQTIRKMFVQKFAREEFKNRQQAMKFLAEFSDGAFLSSETDICKNKPTRVIHLGGSILDLSNNEILSGKKIKLLDLKGNPVEWKQLPMSLPRTNSHMGVASYAKKIFITGGRDAEGQFLLGMDSACSVYKTTYMFTLQGDQLKTLPEMQQPRSHHGFIEYEGNLWAVGGSTGSQILKEVESLHPITHEWSSQPPLNVARAGAAIAVHCGEIWAIGGLGEGGEILDSVEVYNSKEGFWRYQTALPKRLMLAAAISICGQLYLIGGVTGTLKNPQAVSLIETFDACTNKWKLWTNMNQSRLNHTVSNHGNFLIISGGHTLKHGVPKPVEPSISYDVFNPEKDQEGRRTAYKTPILGTNRLGAGIVLVCDTSKITQLLSISTEKSDEKECMSCASLQVTQPSLSSFSKCNSSRQN